MATLVLINGNTSRNIIGGGVINSNDNSNNRNGSIYNHTNSLQPPANMDTPAAEGGPSEALKAQLSSLGDVAALLTLLV